MIETRLFSSNYRKHRLLSLVDVLQTLEVVSFHSYFVLSRLPILDTTKSLDSDE